jgi:hypothetical protein
MLKEWKWVESEWKMKWLFDCLVWEKMNRKWEERKECV